MRSNSSLPVVGVFMGLTMSSDHLSLHRVQEEAIGCDLKRYEVDIFHLSGMSLRSSIGTAPNLVF